MPPDQTQSAVPTPTPTPPPPDTIAQIAAQPHSAEPSKNEVYATICSQIIKDQGLIIGALTYEQAAKVPGLQVDPVSYSCTISGDGNEVLGELVEKYREFFGNAAVEVCREAASHFSSRLPNEELPAVLRV